MAELRNTFSWSFSAAEDFDQCRRKRYWAKYAMWGGWKEDATPVQKAAYRLNKMENAYSILGQAVEAAALWVIRQSQAGTAATADQAYDAAAKPLLNRAWKESREGLWKTSPKKYFCLKEHYYNELDAETQKQWVSMIVTQTKRCIGSFIDKVLPRIAHVRQEQEIPVATVAQGDPESFEFEGVKVYAIPDYVYRDGDRLHIHDWKAGKTRERHQDQLNLYGLWATVRHRAAPDHIRVFAEYLSDGRVDTRDLTETDIEEVKGRIRESVAEMSEYLVGADARRNEPMPREDWELAAEPRICSLCNFYELCKPELDAL